MTYSLFEFVKERFEELIQEQPEITVIESTDIDKLKISDTQVSKSVFPFLLLIEMLCCLHLSLFFVLLEILCRSVVFAFIILVILVEE